MAKKALTVEQRDQLAVLFRQGMGLDTVHRWMSQQPGWPIIGRSTLDNYRREALGSSSDSAAHLVARAAAGEQVQVPQPAESQHQKIAADTEDPIEVLTLMRRRVVDLAMHCDDPKVAVAAAGVAGRLTREIDALGRKRGAKDGREPKIVSYHADKRPIDEAEDA